MSESQFHCPKCGAPLSVTPIGKQAGFDVRMFAEHRYGDGAASPWIEATRTTPHAHTPNYDTRFQVGVTLAQSAITAGVITLPAVAVTIAAGWPVHVPLIVGSVSFSVSWFWLLRDARGLLRVVERVTNRDIDGDGKIGDEPVSARSVRVEVTEKHAGGTTMRFLDMPLDEAQIRIFAKGILDGKPFSERAWAGDGKPFSQNDFAALRDKLIETGYARWKGGEKRMGAELTAKGRAMFAGLAGDPTPPPQR